MRIISYDLAKVTVLFPFEEVAPLNATDIPKIVASVGSRYNFSKAPDQGLVASEIEKTGIKFESGFWDLAGVQQQIADFTTFSDGVVITSRTTSEGEAFWNDLIPWLQNELGFRPFLTPPVMRFLSQIVVEFDRPVEKFVNKYSEIMQVVSTEMANLYGVSLPMEFSRIDFSFDSVGRQSTMTIPRFVIERRISIPYDRNRYMCNAPMRTENHANVLRKIDELKI